MTAPELKPCPFCGAVDPEWLASHVVCDCGATGPRQDVDREYQADAMRALTDWNRRADLAAVQPAQVRVKPLDVSYVQRHAFLSGVVAARNVAPYDPVDGHGLWLDYDPGDNPALARILATLEPQPDPRDEVIAWLVEAADNLTYEFACDLDRTCEYRVINAGDTAWHRFNAALAAAKAVQHG